MTKLIMLILETTIDVLHFNGFRNMSQCEYDESKIGKQISFANQIAYRKQNYNINIKNGSNDIQCYISIPLSFRMKANIPHCWNSCEIQQKNLRNMQN